MSNVVFQAPDLPAPANTPVTTHQNVITVQQRIFALRRSIAETRGIIAPVNTPIRGAPITPSLTELHRRYSTSTAPGSQLVHGDSSEMSREQDDFENAQQDLGKQNEDQIGLCNCITRFLFY